MVETRNMQSPGDSGKPDFWDIPLTLEQEIKEAERLGINCRVLRNCMPRWEKDWIEGEEIVLGRFTT